MKKYIKDITHLVKEYHFDKNKDIDLEKLTHGSGIKVWWKCKNGHEWIVSPNQRTSYNTDCPYCCNQKACKDNCLAVTHPHLLKEWSKNNKILNTQISSGSNKNILWVCKKCKEEWKSTAKSRTRGSDCPYCAGRKVNKYNCLSTLNPSMAKEWNYDKNTIKPTDVTISSGKKVWWVCPEGHEWEAQICNRSANKSGCPRCNESKGEKLVAQALDLLKIRYKREYKFKELGRKRFDFALFQKYKRKPWAIIEFHGQQHYKEMGYFPKNKRRKILARTQKNDKIKKKYCLDNNIKYLEIPYTKKDDVEQIIKEFLK